MKKFFLFISLFSMLLVSAQQKAIDWLTFKELEENLSQKPAKVLVYFYADWCVYCKKMEQSVFSKPDVQRILNADFYAVKFNAESTETVRFGGKTFVNAQIDERRNPFHQIPEFMAGRPDKNIELPAMVLLNEDFEIVDRYYRYIPPKEMVAILKKE